MRVYVRFTDRENGVGRVDADTNEIDRGGPQVLGWRITRTGYPVNTQIRYRAGIHFRALESRFDGHPYDQFGTVAFSHWFLEVRVCG